MNENIPQPVENFEKEILIVKAALKSGQAEGKGFDTAYFADHESLLEDGEIMALVANQYPYVLGHIREKNKDKDFVITWLRKVDQDKVEDVYREARRNSLRISLSDGEIEKIRESR